MFLATDGIDDETAQPMDSDQPCHLLEDCIFLYSTAEGNPAIRNKVGSNFIQVSLNFKYQQLRQCVFIFIIMNKVFSQLLNDLSPAEDIQDLYLKLKQSFKGEPFKTEKHGTIFVAPNMTYYINKKFVFPDKKIN